MAINRKRKCMHDEMSHALNNVSNFFQMFFIIAAFDSLWFLTEYPIIFVCQNCYFQIRLIRRLGKALSVESKHLLVHALVHSRLDYCNSVLVRLPWSLVQQLQSVLNSAARLIFGLKRFDHITPALMDLHWLPYPQRITYKLCMIMFKCLRGSAPQSCRTRVGDLRLESTRVGNFAI